MTEEELKNMRRIIASENGKKGAKAQWEEKYPAGSPEREKRTAHLREAAKKGGQANKKRLLDSHNSYGIIGT